MHVEGPQYPQFHVITLQPDLFTKLQSTSHISLEYNERCVFLYCQVAGNITRSITDTYSTSTLLGTRGEVLLTRHRSPYSTINNLVFSLLSLLRTINQWVYTNRSRFPQNTNTDIATP